MNKQDWITRINYLLEIHNQLYYNHIKPYQNSNDLYYYILYYMSQDWESVGSE